MKNIGLLLREILFFALEKYNASLILFSPQSENLMMA